MFTTPGSITEVEGYDELLSRLHSLGRRMYQSLTPDGKDTPETAALEEAWRQTETALTALVDMYAAERVAATLHEAREATASPQTPKPTVVPKPPIPFQERAA